MSKSSVSGFPSRDKRASAMPLTNHTLTLCLFTLFNLQKYRVWHSQSSAVAPHDAGQVKNERSESGFDSINDGILNGDIIHIPLNIPLPPTREAPQPPVEADFSPQQSPIPHRKMHKQPIPDINFIESTPSPVLKGNHDEDADANPHLIENKRNDENNHEKEIKIDELNIGGAKSNVRKEGVISEKIKHEENEAFEIKSYPKDRK